LAGWRSKRPDAFFPFKGIPMPKCNIEGSTTFRGIATDRQRVAYVHDHLCPGRLERMLSPFLIQQQASLASASRRSNSRNALAIGYLETPLKADIISLARK
jgi:hypothetical protein